MNAAFTVRFRGVHGKHMAVLEKMLCGDIAQYPDRMSMESATVEVVEAKPKAKPKAKRNAKS